MAQGFARCGAWARSAGRPCRQPALTNGRCHYHGGRCKGPPKGTQNNLKHGHFSAEAKARRRALRALIRATPGGASFAGEVE